MFKFPPTSASTVLPETTAPRRVVSPPEWIASVSPAATCVFVLTLESPSMWPRLPDTLPVSATPVCEPTPNDAPAPQLDPLLVPCWLLVLCAACIVTSPSADSTALRPAEIVLPVIVMSLFVPAPVAVMFTSRPAAIVLPCAVLALDCDWL
ncbi:hypothetical protein AWB82_07289 [Caballeronia glebae]|uniref:Uncharacterized protein n=1 Tax=Caballeronia glebae TaxID=1777143 RepID=A0A158DZ32_9BURK|nr:hypothetical protein AWB82_07289 [Caballeronia glebae]